MSKEILKRYNINKTIFEILFNATVNYDTELNNKINIETALPYHFFSKCKHPEKIEKVLRKNNICFLTSLRLSNEIHIFQCKFSNGTIVKYEIQKKYCKSVKDAFKIALLTFLSKDTIG